VKDRRTKHCINSSVFKYFTLATKNIPHHPDCLWNLLANRVLIEKDLKLREREREPLQKALSGVQSYLFIL